MEKRYQVFVSSTFADLIDERRAVMQALLELDCIPAGMELFPASDDDAWTLIKSVIDDCDYYLVVVAGRYGSTDAAGVSYTEKEYDYAVAAGKPVLSFVHADPESLPARHTDRNAESLSKLAAFRAKVQKKLCKSWKTSHELGTAVTTSLVRLVKTHPAEGWVKARHLKTTEDAEKVTRLIEHVRTLEQELEALRRLGVADTSGLAQGNDLVRLEFEQNDHEDVTWNEVFAVVGRACLQLPTDQQIREALYYRWESEGRGYARQKCVEMVKVQFFSLGLIRITGLMEQAAYPTSTLGMPSQTSYVSLRWELTDYGRIKLGELIGAKHPHA